MDVICSGFLSSAGKKRWFILKDVFLLEYQDQPVEGKNIDGLKGLYFLPTCKIGEPSHPEGNTVILDTGACKMEFSATPDNAKDEERYIISWKNTLEYTIDRAQSFKDIGTIEGWLQKRGGKGHEFRNTKKRHFVLKGNILAYYSDKSEDDITAMKGFIEVPQITALVTEGFDKNTDFSVLTNGGKEYIFSAKDSDERMRWIDSIRNCVDFLRSRQFPVSLDSNEEEVLRITKLLRVPKKGAPMSNCFVLTNQFLRFYASDVSKEDVERDVGKGLLGSIPLLGLYIETSVAAGQVTLVDVTGNMYKISSKNIDDLRKWVEALGDAAKDIARQTVRSRETIRLNTFALADQPTGKAKGACVMQITCRQISLHYLMLKKQLVVPLANLKSVDMLDSETFSLKYKRDGEMKQMNLKCRNAAGIYDAIEAVFEEFSENPPSDDEEEATRKEQKKAADAARRLRLRQEDEQLRIKHEERKKQQAEDAERKKKEESSKKKKRRKSHSSTKSAKSTKSKKSEESEDSLDGSASSYKSTASASSRNSSKKEQEETKRSISSSSDTRHPPVSASTESASSTPGGSPGVPRLTKVARYRSLRLEKEKRDKERMSDSKSEDGASEDESANSHSSAPIPFGSSRRLVYNDDVSGSRSNTARSIDLDEVRHHSAEISSDDVEQRLASAALEDSGEVDLSG